MALEAILYQRVGGGFEATIESEDHDHAVIIVQRRSGSAAAVCRAAARSLRASADKFDRLAEQKYPAQGVVQTIKAGA